jgi:predicted aconitase
MISDSSGAEFNTAGDDRVDLVAIGSPHASFAETRRFADLLDARHCHDGTRTIVTVGRKTLADMAAEGILDRLRQRASRSFQTSAGVQ